MKHIRFPVMNETQNTEEKLKIIVEYLWQFHQTVTHELSNLSVDNFNDKTINEMAQNISNILGLEGVNETT